MKLRTFWKLARMVISLERELDRQMDARVLLWDAVDVVGKSQGELRRRIDEAGRGVNRLSQSYARLAERENARLEHMKKMERDRE